VAELATSLKEGRTVERGRLATAAALSATAHVVPAPPTWSHSVRGVAGPHKIASAGHGRPSILERVVTFRREVRLGRETGVTQRALMIRDEADVYWLVCQMQHGRRAAGLRGLLAGLGQGGIT
jgi:hypothetical protein